MSAQQSDINENSTIREALQLLGDSVFASEILHGGGLSDIIRLQLRSGRDVLAKPGPKGPRSRPSLRVRCQQRQGHPALPARPRPTRPR